MFRFSILAGVIVTSGFDGHAQLMSDIAQRSILPDNVPKYSDVVMRSLSFRDDSFEFGSTMQNAMDFHVTRLDWVYIREGDGKYMNEFAAKGIKVGGTINAEPKDSTISVRDINGKAQEVPWLPGYYFFCVNNPGAFQYSMDNIKISVDLGCVAIQRDDPGSGNVNFTNTCCFCAFCKEKAESEGVDLNDAAQRKAFNRASTLDFYKKLYGQADRYAGFALAHSCNGLDRSWDDERYKEIFDMHDYRNGEIIKARTPVELYNLSKETRLRNKAQLLQYTVKGEMDVDLQRKYIALSYATGMIVMVPWDVFINRAPRYFGTKEDYADIFGFIRCIGKEGYLDGYQDAAAGGYDLEETRYKSEPVEIISGNNQISLFARARPGKKNAPVIVHMVKWGGSGSTKIKLLTDNFFEDDALNIKLYTPKPYNEAEHTDAESSGNFKNLRLDRTGDITVSVNGEYTEVDVPDLSPWGILVVEKSDRKK